MNGSNAKVALLCTAACVLLSCCCWDVARAMAHLTLIEQFIVAWTHKYIPMDILRVARNVYEELGLEDPIPAPLHLHQQQPGVIPGVPHYNIQW